MTSKTDFLSALGRTQFPEVKTRTASGLCLHRDNKTGALSRRKSARGEWENLVPNAFPLPAGPESMGGTCPGHTYACKDCYALLGLEFRPAFAAMVAENLRVIVQAHEDGILTDVLLEAVDLSAFHSARLGLAPTFRWHSDGDIFAAWYARAIRRVALLRPEVKMWIYTRSFRPGDSYLGALIGPARPENLHVFLSVDEFNVDDAARQLTRFARHGVRAAILADSPAQRRKLETALGVESVVCPATGRYAHDGKGPSFVTEMSGRRSELREADLAQGACAACKLCLRADSRSVTFNLHNGHHAPEVAVRVLLKRSAA